MAIGPALFDRLLKRVVPKPVPEIVPPPIQVDSEIWVLDRALRFPGGPLLPCRSALVRGADGSIVVISPPPLVGSGSAAAIDKLGPISAIVVPNSFHYVHAEEFCAKYPDARVFVAPAIAERVPGFDGAVELEEHSAWRSDFELSVLGPVRGVSEVLFFHVPSATLILTDIAFNLTEYPRPIDRLLWRTSGIPAGFAPGRTSRRLLLRDREVAARCLSRAAQWPIHRLLFAHGDSIDQDALARFRSVFAAYLE